MRNTFLTTAFLIASLSVSANTQLKVIELSANETAYELAKVQHLDFTSNNEFSIIGKNGQTITKKAYGDTKAIVFSTTIAGTGATSNDASVQIFPNPTQNALHIRGVEKNCNISIFNNQGQTIYSNTAGGDDHIIEVADFEKGIYLLKAGNKVVKFVKE